MSDRSPLEQLLYGQLTRGRSIDSEESFKGIVSDLLGLHGGNVRRAAASAGIGEQTLRDWIKGRHKPSAKGLAKLHATLPARRRRRLPAGREKWMAGKPYIRIHAVTVVPSPNGKKGNDVRERKFEPSPYMPRGALRPVLDLFLAGADMTDVAAAFVDVIAQHYEGVQINPDQVIALTIAPRRPAS